MQEEELVKLVKRCKKQDQKAQMAIYDLFFKAMFNTSLRIVKKPALAEDIMQEAFITAFDKVKDLKEELTFSVWLKKIVVNKSLNSLNKTKRFTPLNLVALEAQLDEEYEFAILKDENELNRVVKAIHSLKNNYRIMLSLYYLEGYDYEEIMEITGFTYVNCRTILSRAKECLRKKLNIDV